MADFISNSHAKMKPAIELWLNDTAGRKHGV